MINLRLLVEGRRDVVVYDRLEGRVAVFEAKIFPYNGGYWKKDCEKALQQIDKKMYAKDYDEEYDEIFCYWIAFVKKRCLVKRMISD